MKFVTEHMRAVKYNVSLSRKEANIFNKNKNHALSFIIFIIIAKQIFLNIKLIDYSKFSFKNTNQKVRKRIFFKTI